jgi:DNA-binding protein HU-beta
MNRQEFIEEIAKQTKTSKTEAKKFLDAYIATVTKALKKGDDVHLPALEHSK